MCEMDFEERLISAVEIRPALYNMRHPNYKNNLLRMQLWYEVAKESNSEIDHCRKRWKSIRHRYMEEVKKRKQSSGSGARKQKKWHLFEMLQFLQKFVEERQTVTSLEEIEECDPTEALETRLEQAESGIIEDTTTSIETAILSSESESTFTPSRPHSSSSTISGRTNKRSRIEQLLESELAKPDHDDVEHFLLSLAPMIRRFDDIDRLEIQMEFQKILWQKCKDKKKSN